MKNKNKEKFIRAINKHPQWESVLKNDYEKDIVSRYLNGETFQSISDTYDVSPSTIVRHILGVGKYLKGGIYRRIVML